MYQTEQRPQNAEIAQNLHKALTVGQPNLPGGPGGAAWVPQSLDPLLVNTTFSMDNLVLWQRLAKITNKNPTVQYAELSAYGQPPMHNIYIPEVGTPQQGDTTYIARYDVQKQVGVRGSVSFIAQETNGLFDPLAQESKTRTMELLRKLEWGLWHANSALSAVQFDGFIPRILARSPKSNIYDMRGAPLRQEDLINAATTVASAPNYGTLTHLFLNTACKGDIARGIIPEQRYMANAPGNQAAILGIDPTHVRTTVGDIELCGSPFLDDGGVPHPVVTGDPSRAPAAPSVAAPAVAAPNTGTESKFSASADVGTVAYVVVACNQYGTSAPVMVSPNSPTATQQGQVVNLTITPGPGNLPEFYKIYRTPVNGPVSSLSGFRLIQSVPNSIDGIPQNGAVIATDTNSRLPGTFDAIAFQMDPDLIRLVNMGPMTRIPMAITETAMSFMLRYVCTPQLRAPGRCFYFQNVGLTTGALPPV